MTAIRKRTDVQDLLKRSLAAQVLGIALGSSTSTVAEVIPADQPDESKSF